MSGQVTAKLYRPRKSSRRSGSGAAKVTEPYLGRDLALCLKGQRREAEARKSAEAIVVSGIR